MLENSLLCNPNPFCLILNGFQGVRFLIPSEIAFCTSLQPEFIWVLKDFRTRQYFKSCLRIANASRLFAFSVITDLFAMQPLLVLWRLTNLEPGFVSRLRALDLESVSGRVVGL